MKRIAALLLSICMLFTLNVQADTRIQFSDISDIYLAKEDISDWEALLLALNGYEIPKGYFDKTERSLIENKGVFRTSLEYSKVLIVLKQAGKDPHDFAGYDLVSLLSDFKQIDKTGINGVIFAIFALEGTKVNDKAVWTKDKLLTLLSEYQNTDGGFALAKGWGSDNDITSMAITALSYYPDNKKAKDAADTAFAFMSGRIDDDGLMYYQGNDGSENLSQLIIALSAWGMDLNDERFVKSGKTLYDTLIERYMTAEYKFRHSVSKNADAMATEQAYLALYAMQSGYAYAKKDKQVIPEPIPTSEPGSAPEPDSEPDIFIDSDFIDEVYYEDIIFAYDKGLIQGDGSGAFNPDAFLTKAQAAAILYNAAGLSTEVFIPRFVDVDKDDWYAKYVIGCYVNGFAPDYGGACFEPDAYMTENEFRRVIVKLSENSIFAPSSMFGYISRQKAVSLTVHTVYGEK